MSYIWFWNVCYIMKSEADKLKERVTEVHSGKKQIFNRNISWYGKMWEKCRVRYNGLYCILFHILMNSKGSVHISVYLKKSVHLASCCMPAGSMAWLFYDCPLFPSHPSGNKTSSKDEIKSFSQMNSLDSNKPWKDDNLFYENADFMTFSLA